jgi:hypothetical protein
MGKIEKTAKKIMPNKIFNTVKRPAMIGKHYLMGTVYPLRKYLYPREFHAFCLGIPRTGTASVAGLFQQRYRAEHEAQDVYTTEKIVHYLKGGLTKKQMNSFILKRDRSLWLELESSHFLYFFIDMLVREFEQAKFILLMRDCYSWLNSYINHQLGRPLSDRNIFWKKLRDIYFKDDFKHVKEEQILAEMDLYTIDGYLSRWKAYNEKIFSTVPKNRLMVIRTPEISKNIENMEKFLDIPLNSLDRSQSHLNKRTKSFDVLQKIDKKYLKEKIDFYCKDLMEIYFPEFSKMDS